MDSIKTQLLDMGFHEAKVKRAIESCPDAQTLEQIMEWLIAHEDELNAEPSLGISTAAAATAVAPVKVAKVETSSAATGSAGLNDNVDRSQHDGESNETAANMAARKKITVEEAQRIISERQVKRAEEERKKEIEDERKRRLNGQKMAETRAELQDQERIRLAQQIRKEKLEKEQHRKRVLEQIALDREAMRLRNNPKPISNPEVPSPSAKPSCPVSKSEPKAPAVECRIALRFPDGSSLVQKFSPQEQLSAVRLFVQINKGPTDSIEFVAPPNKKLSESMMNETLESLGLCPASRLEVKYKPAHWTDMD